jgi:hypothetical protein
MNQLGGDMFLTRQIQPTQKRGACFIVEFKVYWAAFLG